MAGSEKTPKMPSARTNARTGKADASPRKVARKPPASRVKPTNSGPGAETKVGRNQLNAAERAERAAAIVALRRDSVSFDEIGARFGISHQRAYQIYTKALADRPALQVDEHRAEEAAVIERATRDLIALATDPNGSERTRVEAWNALRGWREHFSKLFGIYAPTKLEVHTLDQLDRELAALDIELAALGDVPDSPASLETG